MPSIPHRICKSESFPCMWDQLGPLCIVACGGRIIPTYVGSTIPLGRRPTPRTNHSHVCGINIDIAMPRLFLIESFPRMWDQRNIHILHFAGIESFPRMWDQRPRRHVCHTKRRIIPTYVGSTARCVLQVRCPSNHSHVCGINISKCHRYFSLFESFPRMWDQPSVNVNTSPKDRIIPTYVGSTRPRYNFFCVCANHSHVCGINMKSLLAALVTLESFPRMWDQRVTGRALISDFRIIPTYVGSTLYDAG